MASNVLWDFDGTLFDTYPAIVDAFAAAMARLGHSADRRTISVLAHSSLSDCITHLASDSGAPESDVAVEFRRFYGAIPLDLQPPFPGVRQIVSQVVASGGVNVVVTHRDAASADRFLTHYRMDRGFAGVVSADDRLDRKPDPAMFIAALRRFQLEASRTIAVGDRPLDVEGAHAAKLRAGAYRFEDSRAEFCFSEYPQFARYLNLFGKGV